MPNKTEVSSNYQDPDVATGQSVLPSMVSPLSNDQSQKQNKNKSNSLNAGARIMKIIKTDDDIYQCNKQATHLVSVATVRTAFSNSNLF
jgi:hypothetical protein